MHEGQPWRKKNTPFVVVFSFCFVECIEVIFTHHYSCHIASMCLQGRNVQTMSTFGMETEMNK